MTDFRPVSKKIRYKYKMCIYRDHFRDIQLHFKHGVIQVFCFCFCEFTILSTVVNMLITTSQKYIMQSYN